jgi:aspartate racemase
MKRLGMIGGITWKNTIEYYDKINSIVNLRLGQWNSAELLLYSLNFQQIFDLQTKNDWDSILEEIQKKSKCLETAGADCLFICSNTLHKIASELQTHLKIPIIDVRLAVAEKIKEFGLDRPLLLGTKFTMEGTFYHEIMNKNNIKIITPSKGERIEVNRIIYEELGKGIINHTSKLFVLSLIKNFIAKNEIDSVILGCTELPLLIKSDDIDVPLFDTMEIHIHKAVEYILQ